MNLKRRQQGMTFWMLLFILVVIGIVVLVGLKLFPIYFEGFKIGQTVTRVVKEPNIGDMSKREISETLVKRFDIEDVRRITERNLKDYVTVNKQGRRVTITVSYRAETHLIGNLYMVAEFNKRASN